MNAILADTGLLPAAGGFITQSLASSNVLGGALTTGLLTATTQGASYQSRSQAQVANLNLTTGGNTITGDLVPASSQCTCPESGSPTPFCEGGIYIDNLRLNGVFIPIMGVNQTVTMTGGSFIINEQLGSSTGNTASLTVNGVHITTATSDVIISSAQSGIVCATTQ